MPLQFYSFVGDQLQATNELWIVGDGEGFIKQAYSTLQGLKKETEEPGRRRLYVYEKYEVIGFMSPSPSLNCNPVMRLLNPVIEAINTHPKLPHHLLILIDENMVRLGEIDLADDTIKWLIMELWTAILARPDQLPLKAKPLFDTLITIIKPLVHPEKSIACGNYAWHREK